jgi:[acyl-carrier-protein] S-malonyltransferase
MANYEEQSDYVLQSLTDRANTAETLLNITKALIDQARQGITDMIAAYAALGVTVTDSTPTEEQLLPDLTAQLEIGSIAAGTLADPLARAVFAHFTAGVDVDAETVTGYRRRNPDRFAGQAEPEAAIAAMLGGAARRRAFRLWLDQRRAALVELAPGYEHPGDPRQPDNIHRH